MKTLFLLLASLIVPGVANANIFGPLSPSMQINDSGFDLSYAHVNLNYRETVPGMTLDRESGDLQGAQMAVRHQTAHFGTSFTLRYVGGNTDYDGYLQNQITGALIPYQSTSPNHDLNLHLSVNTGFSPGALPHFAILPGAEAGMRVWWRGQNQGYDYQEIYRQPYWAGFVKAQYELGRFTLSAKAALGHTYSVVMHSDLNGDNYNLGSAPWRQYSAELAYRLTPELSVLADYAHTRVTYGRSAIHYDGTFEPDSRTLQNFVGAGLRAKF